MDYEAEVLKIARRILLKRPQLSQKILDSVMGKNGIYDPSVWDIMPIGFADLQNKSVLDIGVGGFESTLDILGAHPGYVTALEPFPFGASFDEEETLELLKVKTHFQIPGISRINLYLQSLSMESYLSVTLQTRYDFGFAFFPYPGDIGSTYTKALKFKSFRNLWDLGYGYGLGEILRNNLSIGGKLYIVTEVTDPFIIDMDCVSHHIYIHDVGNEPRYSEALPYGKLETARPITNMNLKIVEYTKTYQP